MKKPDITKGEWHSDSSGRIYRRPIKDLYKNGGSVAGDYPLATAHKGRISWDNHFNQEENAKAISAVPEMIEALIECRTTFIKLNKEINLPVEAHLKMINKSIEKAGCK